MSKLIKAIDTYQTNRVAELGPIPISCMSIEEHYNCPNNWTYEYNIGIRLQYKVLARDSEELTYKKKQVARMFAEEVFGEFRIPLLEARLAMMHRDEQKASELIEQVLNGMFGV